MVHPLPIDGIGPLMETGSAYVLLDTARPTRTERYSYFFHNSLEQCTARSPGEVLPLLERIDRWTRRGWWVGGYIAYEAAYAIEERLHPLREASSRPPQYGWFAAFERPFRFDHVTGRWTPPLPVTGGRGKTEAAADSGITLTPGMDYAAYRRAVGAIKRWIGRGHTYQVNYTFDVRLSTRSAPWDLYRLLRTRQKAAYGAFIRTGTEYVCSFSPELFFRRRAGTITAKPMKGTAPRGRDREEDGRIAGSLGGDPKNRSENVMIVDLLRNDLGRICRSGSVRVPRLFEIEKYPTVFQMTSTVRGRLEPRLSTAAVFTALFPCGSVTGAPKIRTMEIIRSLEKGCRGVYCGALGYVSPRGDAVFSVPIRTLRSVKGRGGGRWVFRVGSGIVWDSSARAEWRECAEKCAFLTRSEPRFELFESILWTPRGFRYLREHVRRLAGSAAYFGFAVRRSGIESILRHADRALRGAREPHKVRVFCNGQGVLRWDHRPVSPSPAFPPRVCLRSPGPDPRTVFLFHKTTRRPWYEGAMREIRAGRWFDVIFVNPRGEVAEGAVSNVFVRMGGMLYTPPLEAGVLPGILRGRMLKRGACRERVLRPSDLRRAEAVYCGNSVRGLTRVRVVSAPRAARRPRGAG